MAAFEVVEVSPKLKLAARRAYERGRLQGALLRGAAALLLAAPGFLACGQSRWAAACLAGFALVVAAGWMRGEGYSEGSRAGALAGILPCLLPVSIRAINPDVCTLLFNNGLWICGVGGAAAGVILGLRGRASAGLPFWGSAVAALGFAASIGCLPAGAMGFAGLALGVLAGGTPVLVARRALV
jgi:hypothetical protein